MFDSLTSKLDKAFSFIKGQKTIKEKDLDLVLKEIKLALLEADVNFQVVKELLDLISTEAKGERVLKSLTPDQQIIKIVNEKLTELLGSSASEINLKVKSPLIIMLVGLQGSGKTTTSAKLANWLKTEHKKEAFLVPLDVYRPAAIEQLKTLGGQIEVPVFDTDINKDPVKTAQIALKEATKKGYDCIILDTAGRLQIDSEMMAELSLISDKLKPHEILLVADAMTGQTAVDVAKGFDQALDIDGLILSKMDGDARGGAALSMKHVTGKSIKFIGIGEKTDALEVFHPERLASRILGMGDVLSLIEKASKKIDEDEALKMSKKMRKNQFTLDDFYSQLKMMRSMGGMSSIMGMIPGANKLMKQVDPEAAEKELKKIEAMILSMTPKERAKHIIINGNRRKRIAKGSGTTVNDLNKLLKQFAQMKKMMTKLNKGGMGKMLKMLNMNPGDLSKITKGL